LLASFTKEKRGCARCFENRSRPVFVMGWMVLAGALNLLAGCAENATSMQTPMAWTAEVSAEAPVVTASLVPEPVSPASSPSQTLMPQTSKAPEAVQSIIPEERPKKLRKGGGYRKLGKRYQVAGTWYTPRHDENYEETGLASWYGKRFHAKKTANGEIYDMNALTAAHRTLPLPSLVRVTNIENGRSLVVRVNDRGPFRKGRIIDVSERVARELGFAGKGLAKVHVKYIGPARLEGGTEPEPASEVAAKR